VLVVRGRITSLRRQLACLRNALGIVRNQHPTPRGGEDLVAVEGVESRPAQGAGSPAFVGRPQRLGGVLDQGHLIAIADRQDRIKVGALPVEMDHDHGFGQSASAGALLHRGIQQFRVHVPGKRLAVNEHRPGAQVADRIGAGGKGEG
jgi:hypothetical protein